MSVTQAGLPAALRAARCKATTVQIIDGPLIQRSKSSYLLGRNATGIHWVTTYVGRYLEPGEGGLHFGTSFIYIELCMNWAGSQNLYDLY